MRMKYCVGVGKNRPVIDWLNQVNKLVIEGYITKRRRN